MRCRKFILVARKVRSHRVALSRDSFEWSASHDETFLILMMMRGPPHPLLGGSGGGGGGWRLVGFGFVFGAAFATCLLLGLGLRLGRNTADYRRGFWHAQRASERWCFPRGESRVFPLIQQWDHATPEAALRASSVASGRIDRVERIRLTSAKQFETELLAKEQPAVIEGLTEGWPAWLGDTSAEGGMAQRTGEAKMRVEKSANGRFGHVEPTWGDTEMTLREFFAGGHCERPGGGGGSPSSSSSVADDNTAGRGGGDKGGDTGDESNHKYLSFNPPDDFLDAMGFESWPVPCLSQAGGRSAAVRELLMWIGTGTDSSLHNDSWENVFCVTSGRKDVLLLDPAQGALVGERVGFDRVSFVLDPAMEADTYYKQPSHQRRRRRQRRREEEEEETKEAAKANFVNANAAGKEGASEGEGEGEEGKDSESSGGGGDSGDDEKKKKKKNHNTEREREKLHAEGKPTGPIAPLKVSVHPGECLYIPSYWFHQVISPPEQCTVAVTLWLDLLRLTSRVTGDERIHLPSSTIKQRLLGGGGLPVRCHKTVHAEEDNDDDEDDDVESAS